MLRIMSKQEVKERTDKILKWVKDYLKKENGYKLENMLYELKDLLDKKND